MHGEESTHDTRDGAHGDLYWQRGLHLDMLADGKKPKAGDDEHHTEDAFQQVVVGDRDKMDGGTRRDDEGDEDRRELMPIDLPPVFESHEDGSCHGQNAR